MTMKTFVTRGVRVVGVVVVVVLAAWLGVRILAGQRLRTARRDFRSVYGTLDVKTLASPLVPDEQNAALPVRAGAMGLLLTDDDKKLVGHPDDVGAASWTRQQAERLRAILTTNAAALELVHQASRLSTANFGVEPTWDAELSGRIPLLQIMWLSRLLYAQALQAQLDGDRVTMLRAVDSMSAMTRAVQQEPLLISQLVGIATERMMLGTIRSLAGDSRVTPDDLQHLQTLVGTSDLRAAWRRSMALEGLTTASATSRILARDDETNPYKPATRLVWRAVPDLLTTQPLETATTLATLMDRPFGVDPTGIENAGKIKMAWSSNVFRDTNSPVLAKSAGRFQTLQSQRRLTRLGLGVRLDGVSAGAYPTDLGSFPEAKEPDPFTGKPIGYERRADGSARLWVPDGEVLWPRIAELKNYFPFTWELPAPATVPAGK
jgi:hypothetical protein